ncbi:peptidase [Listeria sp. PSOL-1]|uniref:peptidase n=1 Tax=Listeria sp. PSOL-1 TaxID=1844999 RepID=UPI0013D621C4|nr:peptidase [Listeria sp. PSOL-1]
MTALLFLPFLFLLCAVFGIAGRVLLAIWIYKDAESRNMNAALWCLLIAFTSVIIVMIVYFIIKKPAFEDKKRLGLLISGCILTVITFILSIVFFVTFVFGIIQSFEDGSWYDNQENIMDGYDFDNGYENF